MTDRYLTLSEASLSQPHPTSHFTIREHDSFLLHASLPLYPHLFLRSVYLTALFFPLDSRYRSSPPSFRDWNVWRSPSLYNNDKLTPYSILCRGLKVRLSSTSLLLQVTLVEHLPTLARKLFVCFDACACSLRVASILTPIAVGVRQILRSARLLSRMDHSDNHRLIRTHTALLHHQILPPTLLTLNVRTAYLALLVWKE